ncbi:MAG: AAA family ATPase, partial [bacterium]|nr:AAA family ATPase [bacterium]
MAAASEERSKELAEKVDQLAAQLSRLEQTLSPPTQADSQLYQQLSTPSPFISRVRLKQYRSIAACDVALGPLTVLVGPNGSGKSNFLDALALIADALQNSLEQALRSRGGIGVVQHRSARASGPVELAVEFHLTPELRGEYEFAV